METLEELKKIFKYADCSQSYYQHCLMQNGFSYENS